MSDAVHVVMCVLVACVFNAMRKVLVGLMAGIYASVFRS
jgi:hypothetical protein